MIHNGFNGVIKEKPTKVKIPATFSIQKYANNSCGFAFLWTRNGVKTWYGYSAPLIFHVQIVRTRITFTPFNFKIVWSKP
jgi:hypothetical protein